MRLVYKLDKEKHTFSRMSLTKLGYIDDSIELVRALKYDRSDGLKRLLVIDTSKDLPEEIVDLIDRKVNFLGEFTKIEAPQDLDQLFSLAEQRKVGYKYIEYFNRATYV